MSGRRSAPSLPNCGDEQEHEHEQEKGMMMYFLFFITSAHNEGHRRKTRNSA